MCIDDWVYFLRCRANSRRCLRRCLAFGYVARCCSRRNARLSCGADNGGRNTSPHTISPFTPFNSVPLRSGAFRFLKPNCVAWLLSNNRKRLLHSSFEVLQQPPVIESTLLKAPGAMVAYGELVVSCGCSENGTSFVGQQIYERSCFDVSR